VVRAAPTDRFENGDAKRFGERAIEEEMAAHQHIAHF
jgi:hypothetical protein